MTVNVKRKERLGERDNATKREGEKTKEEPTIAGLIGATNSANPRYLCLLCALRLLTVQLRHGMATPRPVRPKPLDWPGPPHLDVFITNLKLLCLDQLEDWPGISPRTLSPSSQNQRQRIRLVEWALYQLYNIWDAEGAQNVQVPNCQLWKSADPPTRNSVPFSRRWSLYSPSIYARRYSDVSAN